MLTDRCWPVEAEILMRLVESSVGDEAGPLVTYWRYTAHDPYAVHMDLGDGNVWVIGRELVARGLRAPTGLGDVKVWPAKGPTFIALESHEGRAVLSARHRDLAEFLRRTYAWVGRGVEPAYLDVDATVEELLGGAR